MSAAGGRDRRGSRGRHRRGLPVSRRRSAPAANSAWRSAGCFPSWGRGGGSGERFGFRICSMISGETPPFVRRITSGVDKSKLVLSAERIWLRIRSVGTFSFTISSTLSLVSVVSGGGGGGGAGSAATTGAGGGVCAASSAAAFRRGALLHHEQYAAAARR